MCEASIHVPHRRAREQERLIVQQAPQARGIVGLYPAFPSDATARSIARDCYKLVCTRGRTKAIIKRVRLQAGCPPPLVKKWSNKRNVEVTLFRRHHWDMIKFPDGIEATIHCLAYGTRVDIGIPVKRRTKTGMQVIESALREVMATEPQPGQKPDTPPGQDPNRDKPGNPNPGEGKPAEHPGQGQPTPHPEPRREPAQSRRRRRVTA